MANQLICLPVTSFYDVIILRASTWSNVTMSFLLHFIAKWGEKHIRPCGKRIITSTQFTYFNLKQLTTKYCRRNNYFVKKFADESILLGVHFTSVKGTWILFYFFKWEKVRSITHILLAFVFEKCFIKLQRVF